MDKIPNSTQFNQEYPNYLLNNNTHFTPIDFSNQISNPSATPNLPLNLPQTQGKIYWKIHQILI